jgi:RNA polymerase sigma-70 factor (family 1)
LLCHSQHNEKELVRRTAEGDADAFSALFHQYHQELAGYILRLTHNLSLTEEIVQDSFIKLWVRKELLAEVKDFRSYLFGLSRNRTFNYLRDLARNTLQQQAWVTQVIEQAHDVEEPDREYYFTLIEEAVRHLSPQQQKIYLLSRREGLKQEEIARLLQLSRHTVKRHMSLALRAIMTYVRTHAANVSPLLLVMLLAGS